jgi:hypothetical protein
MALPVLFLTNDQPVKMRELKRLKEFVLLLALLIVVTTSFAQRPTNYTLIQAGSLIGAHRTGEFNPMHGYQFHFTFGKNFRDRLFTGIGLGNDVYRGKNTLPNGTISQQQIMTIPLYADVRYQAFPIGTYGRVGVMANAGYAPSLGSSYMRGGMGKAGLTYSLMLAERSDVVLSAGYIVQQFDSRYLRHRFVQQGAFITIGLWVY